VLLVSLHKPSGDRERQAEVGVGEAPAGELLDPVDPIGERVPMDPEGRGRFREARLFEDGSKRGETLATALPAACQEWLEERACVTLAVRQVAEPGEQAIGRQPVRTGDARRLGQA